MDRATPLLRGANLYTHLSCYIHLINSVLIAQLKIISYFCICTLDIFNGIGNDVRLGKRLNSLLDRMTSTGSSIIHRCCHNVAERTGAYRLIKNERLIMEDIVSKIVEDSARRSTGLEHILCIQDTSEFSFDSHMGRLSSSDPDIGYGTHHTQQYSLYAHPTLLIDAFSGMPLGFSSLQIFNHERSRQRSKSRLKHELPLEQKESFRWAASAIHTAETFPSEIRKTFIGDRENDIYEVMCLTLQAGCEFLIRSTHDRKVGDELQMLSDYMDSLPVMRQYDLSLRGHRGRTARTAKMKVKYSKVSLHKSVRVPKHMPDRLECWCICAIEDESTVPPGEEPVEWRLLTSHKVENQEDAMQCIEWYKCRWFIEELFRICKSKGFRMESAQLEDGASLKKLMVLTLFAALRCMALKRAYDEADEKVPCNQVFDSDEIKVLHVEMKRIHDCSPRAMDGNNPFRENSLPWAAWIIARMGGWSGYPKSHGQPGYITMKTGWDLFQRDVDFMTYYERRRDEKDVYKD